MSGPEDSDYDLVDDEYDRQEEERQRRIEEERRRVEEERRRIDEEQRRQEELKCQAFEASLSEAQSRLGSTRAQIVRNAREKLTEARGAYHESRGIDALEEALLLLQRRVDAFPAAPPVRNSFQLAEHLSAINRLTEELGPSLAEPVLLIAEELRQHGIRVAERNFLEQKFDRTDKKNISLKLKPSAPPIKSSSDDSPALERALRNFHAALTPYLDNLWGRELIEIQQLRASVNKIIEHGSFDAAYKARQIEARRNSFEITKDRYDAVIQHMQKMRAECEQLYTGYAAVCRLLGQECEAFTFEAARAMEQKEYLQRITQTMKERLAKKETADYIARSVNEVMEELGYNIIATDFMARPRHNVIHNMYDFGTGAAINAYTSDNGSLMFEVSGIHEGAKELAEHEKLRLKESMETFCDKYQQIYQRLSARGIKLANVTRRSADIKYAKSIDISKKQRVGAIKSKKAGAAPAEAVKIYRMSE